VTRNFDVITKLDKSLHANTTNKVNSSQDAPNKNENKNEIFDKAAR
jgi:hypothetical protein